MKGLGALFFCLAVELLSQGTVRGHVRDAVTGETLPNASVMVDTLSVGTSASDGGYFVLKSLPVGELAITASYIGYRSRRVSVKVRAGQTVTRDVELEPDALEVEGVEAVGKRISPADITPVGSFGSTTTDFPPGSESRWRRCRFLPRRRD